MRLQNTLRCQALTNGLQGSVQVEVCYPNGGSNNVGDPVRIRLEAPFEFIPLLQLGTITLGADATMRLEQSQALPTGLITDEVGC